MGYELHATIGFPNGSSEEQIIGPKSTVKDLEDELFAFMFEDPNVVEAVVFQTDDGFRRRVGTVNLQTNKIVLD